MNPEFQKEQDFQSPENSSNFAGRGAIKSFEREINLFCVYEKHKFEFFEWLDKYNPKYSKNVKSSINKIFQSNRKVITDIKKAIETGLLTKKSASVAFRVWLNYCEEKEIFESEVLQKFRNKVKLYNKSKIDSYVPNEDEIKQSLEILRNNYPEDCYLLYKIILESGCRFTEIVKILNEFDYSKLEEYGDVILYRNFSFRGQKSSFYLFSTKETMNSLLKFREKFNNFYFESFKKKIYNNKQIVNLKYLRKYNFSLLVKSGVNLEIANFIQGRMSNNVGFNHYLAKKEIAVSEYKKIVNF